VKVQRAVRFAALVLLLLAAAGCWDYADIENRAPILGLGFDRSSDPEMPVLVSAEVPIASAVAPTPVGQAGSERRSPKWIFESTGATVSEAIDMLNKTMARAPVHRHIAALVVSREIAAQGIEPLVDYFLRNSQVNIRAELWVTDGKARDVLMADPPFQPFVSFGLEAALLKSETFPAVPRGVTIEHFNRKIGEGGAIVPRVELGEGELITSGAGVFSPEARFVGFLNEQQTVGAAWFLGSLKSAETTFPCPVDEERIVGVTLRPGVRRKRFEEAGAAAPGASGPRTAGPGGASLEGASSDRKGVDGPGLDGAGAGVGLSVLMEIAGTVEVSNLSGCRLFPWKNAEDRRLLAEAAARAVKLDAEAAVRRAQELGVDFLGIGLQLSRRKPGLWKALDWPEIFPKVPIDVSVRMTVGDPGSIHDVPVSK